MAERLADMLEDPDPTRAGGAAAGIEALIRQYEDREFSAVLPALLRALERKEPILCLLAASAICSIDPESVDLTKALLRASREGCPDIVFAIIETRQLSDEDVGELIDSLGRDDAQLRKQVAYALGLLESHRERAVPALVALLRDESGLVIHAALSSLQRLEHRDPATIREVTSLLGREAVRMYAVEYLAGNTSSSPEALAVLRAALRNSSEASEFLDALGNAAPETLSPDLIPDLLHLCRAGPDLDQRMSAVELLGSMGPAAKSAVPVIEEALAKNDDEDFKWAARAAIESIRTAE